MGLAGEQQTKVKICGLRRLEDVQAVNIAQPQYAGFVFAPSKRQITPELAQQLRQTLQPSIQAVGVFVNAVPQEVAKLCEQNIIQMVQLHGREDATYIQQLRALVDVPIIKAVRVQTSNDILHAQQLDCDFLLLDTYIAGVAGGSGKQFDYQKIPPLYKPFFLAGGLSAMHVQQAIALVHPYAVDVSSGVETDGWKDTEKIQEFVQKVRFQAC